MHYTGFGKRSLHTPQTEPIPGSAQIKNSAGGYSFAIDDMTRLHRLLVIGSAANTYYADARALTKQNLDAVERLLQAGRGTEVVDAVVAISEAGRGISNDPALFVLARCCACDAHPSQPLKNKAGEVMGEHRRVVHPYDIVVRRYAYRALPLVARTGTHLLHFMAYVKQFRGFGPMHDRAIEAWYQDKYVESLAYQALKYQQRDGWSQRDVLRLARPKATNAKDELYHWIAKGEISTEILVDDPLVLIRAYEQAKKATNDKEVARLIKTYRLPREAVPTKHLKSIRVWEALLEDMPMEAMTRNLATMTRNEVLVPMSDLTCSVATRLRNQDAIRKARLHPIKILAALMTYQSGKSARGSSTWTPLREIVDALNDAFYLAFGNVEPSGKRIILGLDISGSMGMGEIANIPGMTPRVGSAAMALVTAATEPNYTIMGFSHEFISLNISPKQRLDDAVRAISGLPFGGTDCALPMLWAMQNNVQADAFIILTDSETYANPRIHPAQALQAYRQKFGIPAKLIVVGMVANGFTIADPNDAGMIDVVGFDVNTPSVISSFLSGAF